MKGWVTFADAALTLAVVRLVPSWWRRLLGEQTVDGIAHLCHGSWVWDGGHLITERRVIRALDRQRHAHAAEMRRQTAAPRR